MGSGAIIRGGSAAAFAVRDVAHANNARRVVNNTVLQSDDEELKRITARHRSVNLETRTSSLFVRENHYAIIQSIVAVATIGLGGHTILPLKSAEAGGNTQSIPYTTNPSADYLVTS